MMPYEGTVNTYEDITEYLINCGANFVVINHHLNDSYYIFFLN